MFKKLRYEDPNSRQKENFNFQKVAAHLADYGFNCLRLFGAGPNRRSKTARASRRLASPGQGRLQPSKPALTQIARDSFRRQSPIGRRAGALETRS
jgi:hypothetical protein